MLTKLTKKGELIYFSVVEKESDKGVKFNERLFVYLQNQFFGYISTFDKKYLVESCDLKKLKKQVPLQDLRKVVPKENILVLYINQYDDGKLKSIKWTLKMASVALAFNWMELLTKQNVPFRKTTEFKEPSDKQEILGSKPFVEENNDLFRQFQTKNSEEKKLEEQKRIQMIKQEEIKKLEKQKLERERAERQKEVIKMKMEQQKLKKEKREREERQKNERLKKQLEIEKNKEKMSKQTIKEDIKHRKSIGFQELMAMNQSSDYRSVQRFSDVTSLRKEPPKEQEKGKDLKISKLLENKIDFEKIQQELESYKQTKSQIGHSPSSDIRFQLQNISFKDYYRQLPTQIDDQRYFKFIRYCQNQMKKIVSDLRKKTNHQELIKIQLPDMNVVMIFYELKQVPDKTNVCDSGLYKKYIAKLKNTNYLWKVISSDQILNNFFYIPMSCMCQYKGFLGFFQCKFSLAKHYDNHDFSEQFDRLSQKSHIHKQVLENKENISFEQIQNGFAIHSVNNFLPIMFVTNTLVRPQTFEEVMKDSQWMYELKKGKKEQYQQNKLFKGHIEEKIKHLSQSFSKLLLYVIHPAQMSTLLHSHGLSVKHIQKIYENTDNSHIKDILATDAAIRAFKSIFRKKMQDSHESQNPDAIAFNLINVFLNQSSNSQQLWKIVTLQAQLDFGIPVNRSDMVKGYLFLGLQHHLGLKIQPKYSNCDRIFNCEQFIENVEFQCKVNTYDDFDFELKWETSHEQVQKLVSAFHLKEKNLPFCMKLNQLTEYLILFKLSNYYGPNDLRHLKLYEGINEQQINIMNGRRHIAKIKWLIRDNEIDEKQVQAEMLMLKDRMTRYFGHYHPFYDEIYQLLTNYNMNIHKHEKGINFCKMALGNMIQLCGGNNMHEKLAANHYELGQCYYQWNRIDEAISQYKKAKNILEFNSQTHSKQYALIQLKLAHLHFSKFKDTQCQKLIQNTFKILKNNINQVSDQIISCLELMDRCLTDPYSKTSLVNESEQILKYCLEENLITDNQSLRIGKIIIEHYLKKETLNVENDVEELLERISDVLTEGHIDTQQSIQTFQEFAINNKLLDTLQNFCSKAKTLFEIYKKKLPLTDKALIQLDRLIRSSLSCFGEGFMMGAIHH